MATKVVNLPLYPEAYYSYAIALEGVSYTIEYRYITRMEKWVFDLYTRDREPVILSQVIVPDYPITFDYILPMSGFFWLRALPDVDQEKAKQYPREIYKYYRFDYFFYKEE